MKNLYLSHTLTGDNDAITYKLRKYIIVKKVMPLFTLNGAFMLLSVKNKNSEIN